MVLTSQEKLKKQKKLKKNLCIMQLDGCGEAVSPLLPAVVFKSLCYLLSVYLSLIL
jgi:hypothetical protein